MKIRHLLKRKSGFTLVELLVVISIIGILASLILVNLGGARERARDTSRKNDLRQVQTALRLYFNDFAGYPQSSSGNAIQHVDPNTSATTTFAWGSAFTVNGNLYMTLPTDPVQAGNYVYKYSRSSSDSDVYCLWGRLENASDQQIAQSEAKCATPCAGLYTAGDPIYTVCNQ